MKTYILVELDTKVETQLVKFMSGILLLQPSEELGFVYGDCRHRGSIGSQNAAGTGGAKIVALMRDCIIVAS